jgi:hypothetical protein
MTPVNESVKFCIKKTETIFFVIYVAWSQNLKKEGRVTGPNQ